METETNDLPRSYGPRCSKCGRFVTVSKVGAVLDVLTIPGVDIARDVVHCSRDGLTEVSWW